MGWRNSEIILLTKDMGPAYNSQAICFSGPKMGGGAIFVLSHQEGAGLNSKAFWF